VFLESLEAEILQCGDTLALLSRADSAHYMCAAVADGTDGALPPLRMCFTAAEAEVLRFAHDLPSCDGVDVVRAAVDAELFPPAARSAQRCSGTSAPC
jgi:hypothetical protein